jgi:hypothetical protein
MTEKKRGHETLSDHDFYRRMIWATEHKCPNLARMVDEGVYAEPIKIGNETINEEAIRAMWAACYAREMNEKKLDECLPPSHDMENYRSIIKSREMIERFYSCIDNSTENTDTIISVVKRSSKRPSEGSEIDHFKLPLLVHPEWGQEDVIDMKNDSDEQMMKKIESATKKCEYYLRGEYPTRQVSFVI